MTTIAHSHRPSIFTDLIGWMETVASEPDIRVEEYDEDGRHVIRADIPGVDPTKDIELTVDGGILRLRGERRAEQHDKHRAEIRYGAFERVLTLPRGARPEDVKADYANGVLRVSVPAATATEPLTIPVTHRELPAE